MFRYSLIRAAAVWKCYEEAVVPAALDGKEGEVWFEKAESNTGHLRDAPAHVETTSSYRVQCKRLEVRATLSWSGWNTAK